MPVWAIWATFALATARLTRLVTDDEITRPLREALLRRLDEKRPFHQRIATLISCPWCVSVYFGAALAPLFWWHGGKPAVAIPALALSASEITGLLSQVGRD